MDEITEKWKPIMEEYHIPEEHLESVGKYLEHVFLTEQVHSFSSNGFGVSSTTIIDISKTLIPLNLRVISKIDNLSKVTFINTPKYQNTTKNLYIQVGDARYSCDMERSKVEIRSRKLEQILSEEKPEYKEYSIEENLTDIVSDELNKLISQGRHIYAYLLVQSIGSISSQGLPPEIYMKSRFAAIQ